MLEVPTDGLCVGCQELQRNPDALSKLKTVGGVPFKDMKHLDEDDRVKELAKILTDNPNTVVGFMVDTGAAYQGKGDRIIDKLKKLVPDVKIISRRNGPTAGTETIKFAR